MNNGNYSFHGFGRSDTAGNGRGVGSILSKATTSFRFLSIYISGVGGQGTALDDDEVDAMILGDLA
jgi:hypothetical protein